MNFREQFKFHFVSSFILVMLFVLFTFCSKNVYADELTLISGNSLDSVTGYSEQLYNTEEIFNPSDYYSQLTGNGDEELLIAQKGISVEGPGWSTYIDAVWRSGDKYYNISNLASWSIENPELVLIEQGRVMGLKTGKTQATVSFKDKSFTFTVVVGGVAGNTASRGSGSYTSAQRTILNRAEDMVFFKWTPSSDLRGWRGASVFRAGVTVTGMPYSQNVQRTLDEFKGDLNRSDFYENFTRADGAAMPKFGNDCSGFVSISWGIRRQNTGGFVKAIREGRLAKVGSYDAYNPSEADLKNAYRSLKSADAVVKPGHVILVESISGNEVYCYEQTPDHAISSTHTFDELARAKYMPFSFLDTGNKGDFGTWNTVDVPKTSGKTGWEKSNGVWYYYRNGSLARGWLRDKNKWYFLGENGVMRTGWEKIGNIYYYLKSDGSMAENEWVYDGKWYYLGDTGRMLSKQWIYSANKWYYLRSSGEMGVNYWVHNSDGKWYFMGGDGVMVFNTTLKINGVKYKFNSKGACLNP